MSLPGPGAAALGGIAVALAMALFLLPGYFFARALRASAPLLAGFILSLLLLFQGVFWLNLAGLPVSFGSVLTWEVLWTLLAALAARRWRAPRAAGPRHPVPFTSLLLCGLTVLSGAALFLRTSLVPLTGPDNPTRFDLLAIRLLEHRHLHFYPPVTDAQFALYGFPESIPPMLSIAYWWLYAAWGAHRPALTAGFITLQFAAVVGVAYRLATLGEDDPKRPTGALAAVLVACSPLVLFSMLLGQEAGLMTVAVGGMLYFILAGDGGWRGAVLAGASAALAAVTREYGLAYVALGAVLMLWQRHHARWVAVYLATAIALAAPWYVRTWVLTGSPVYSVPVGRLFAENPVVADFYRSVRERQGVTHLSAGHWRTLGAWIVQLAPLQVTLGLVAILGWGAWGRRNVAIGVSILVLLALWLASIGLSNSLLIWLRTLTPVVVLVSVLMAPLFAFWITRSSAGRMLVLAALLIVWAYTLIFTLVYPQRVSDTPPDQWATAALGRQSRRWEWQDFKDQAPTILRPNVNVLTADMYAHTVLHGSPHDGVAVWQPSTRFLFDAAVDPRQATQRLSALGVGAVWFVNNDLWDPFLRQHSPFFAELGHDTSPWRPVAKFGSATLYALPEAVSAENSPHSPTY
jgi:hypothetical protein